MYILLCTDYCVLSYWRYRVYKVQYEILMSWSRDSASGSRCLLLKLAHQPPLNLAIGWTNLRQRGKKSRCSTSVINPAEVRERRDTTGSSHTMERITLDPTWTGRRENPGRSWMSSPGVVIGTPGADGHVLDMKNINNPSIQVRVSTSYRVRATCIIPTRNVIAHSRFPMSARSTRLYRVSWRNKHSNIQNTLTHQHSSARGNVGPCALEECAHRIVSGAE